jgi:hypothetical protein
MQPNYPLYNGFHQVPDPPPIYTASPGYTITTPGSWPPLTTYVNPDGNGGYTVTTPGAWPPLTTYIRPQQ